MVAQNCWSGQLMFKLIKYFNLRPMIGTPCPILPRWTGTWGRIPQRAKVEPNTTGKKKKGKTKKERDMIPNDILKMHTWVDLSTHHQRNFHQQETGVGAETYIQKLSGEIRESYEIEWRRTVGMSRDGGQQENMTQKQGSHGRTETEIESTCVYICSRSYE